MAFVLSYVWVLCEFPRKVVVNGAFQGLTAPGSAGLVRFLLERVQEIPGVDVNVSASAMDYDYE